MKRVVWILVLCAAHILHAQELKPIDTSGAKLKTFYLNLYVEHLWRAGHAINWETGQIDKTASDKKAKTYSGAFVAATCKRINIYILRPPKHSITLLANAQYDWLQTSDAYEYGWHPITGAGMYNLYAEAQNYANTGYVVVAVYQSPTHKKQGLIAFVLPDNLTQNELKQNGVELIMAGTHNYSAITLRKAFKHYITTWPDSHVLYYYNTRKIQ